MERKAPLANKISQALKIALSPLEICAFALNIGNTSTTWMSFEVANRIRHDMPYWQLLLECLIIVAEFAVYLFICQVVCKCWAGHTWSFHTLVQSLQVTRLSLEHRELFNGQKVNHVHLRPHKAQVCSWMGRWPIHHQVANHSATERRPYSCSARPRPGYRRRAS